MTLTTWLLFSSIALMATLSPGPAILLVSTYSFHYGLRPAMATMLGNITGLLLMSSLSVAGLSAIILHSTWLFTLVKVCGALYLIYLGLRLLRHGFSLPQQGARLTTARPSWLRFYVHGVMVALSNPKAIVFTTALFPQFIDATQAVLPQFAVLVLTFMSLSFVCLLGYGLLAAGAGKRAAGLPAGRTLGRLFGALFIAAGLLLAGTPQRV